ncbi:MAG: helix-turn-helix domain containing protein [Deltaproteobacteria bacterium]|nr:helix-turn-helix domain containing protein [Deltaproteobacteria bacterium]
MTRTRSGPAPVSIPPLAEWVRKRLRRMARGHDVDAQVSLRARMIRMLQHNPGVRETAARLDIDVKTVRLWRDRFLAGGIHALRDRKRTGRKRAITEVERCELISMACGRPKDYGVLFQPVWTFDALHLAFQQAHSTTKISRTSVIRILRASDLRPHRIRCGCTARTRTFGGK